MWLRRLAALAAFAATAATAVAMAAAPGSRECNLVFVEDTNAALSRQLAHLVFRLDYPHDKLDFGDPVACAAHELQAGVTASFTNDPLAGVLEATLSRANGLFPYPLVACTPLGAEDAQAATLDVTVIDSRDTADQNLDPPAAVSVETFECTTTTTSLVSTTTVIDGTTTTTTDDTTTTTQEPPLELCGDADANGSITASDALLALQAAVGAAECALSRCDTNASGSISASDSLRILRKAIGIDELLDCTA